VYNLGKGVLMAINLETLKPFIPVVLPIVKGIVGKTGSRIDDAALTLIIVILEDYFKIDIDPEV